MPIKLHWILFKATAAVAGAVWVCGTASAQSAVSAPTQVAQTEQATRDSGRLTILRAELAKEQARLLDAVKRKAERLAAKDTVGVQEAEAVQQRATSNIDALRREIDVASGSKAPAPANGNAPARTAARQNIDKQGEKTQSQETRWWDVYNKPQRMSSATVQQVSLPQNRNDDSGEQSVR